MDFSYNGTEQVRLVSYSYISIGIIMAVLFVLALIENISVLIVYINNRKLHTLTNFWIIAVIVCDLLIVLNAFPFVIISSFAEKYVFGDFGCKWDGFIITLLGTSSIFLFTGLSIYRYQIMVYRNRAKNTSKTKVVSCILFCFVLGLFWGVMPILGWGSFDLEGIGISCATNWRSQALSDVTYTACMYISVLLLPLLLIGYCYSKILAKVWRETRANSEWIQKRRVKRDVRVTITIALTIASFLVSWTPYAVISFCESFLNMDIYKVSPFLVMLPCLMAKTACIWNPLVYVCHNDQFRKAFIKQFQLSQTSRANALTPNTEFQTSVQEGVDVKTSSLNKDQDVGLSSC